MKCRKCGSSNVESMRGIDEDSYEIKCLDCGYYEED